MYTYIDSFNKSGMSHMGVIFHNGTFDVIDTITVFKYESFQMFSCTKIYTIVLCQIQ